MSENSPSKFRKVPGDLNVLFAVYKTFFSITMSKIINLSNIVNHIAISVKNIAIHFPKSAALVKSIAIFGFSFTSYSLS